MLNSDGDIIENLYAAGDMVFGGNILSTYVGNRGVGTALYSGWLAGGAAEIREYLQQ